MFSRGGKDIPTKDTLQHCFNGNPDGAGYAYLTEKDTWQVKKGFMDFDSFWEAWEKEEFSKAHTIVAHFRIGTSGRCPSKHGEWGKGEMCTHPFPVSDEQPALEATEYESESIVIHNGVVGKGEGFLSDTMVAIRDHITPLHPYIWEDEKVAVLMEDLIDCGPRFQGSRWFVTKGKDIRLLGGWVEDKSTGCMYTHTGFKHYPAVQGNSAWWNHYGLADDWGETSESPFGQGDWVYKDGKWILKNEKVVEPQFAYFPTDTFHQVSEGGSWSWDKWGTFLANLDADLIGPNEEEDESNEEIYDSNGTSIIALVDKYGNVIWDDVTMIRTEEKSDALYRTYVHHCKECGAANIAEDDVERDDEGTLLCPFCHSTIMPWVEFNHDDDEPEKDGECPNCGEKRHIGKPILDKGDTQCFRCGAIYLDTVKGTDGIVCWDEEIKAIAAKMNEVMGVSKGDN
jgi:DNA-directed RNA polymerase subunit RPC12/RpoP